MPALVIMVREHEQALPLLELRTRKRVGPKNLSPLEITSLLNQFCFEVTEQGGDHAVEIFVEIFERLHFCKCRLFD